ncbi:MAG: hypothetical protein GVY36_09170 [Verrucomicrobia bacterium]|jgi:DNA-binding transcriptional regulator YiaG|nr:hypothetical protein [Verrucomicrobiota bacterium]
MPKNKKNATSPEAGAADFAKAVAAARTKLGLTQGAFARLLETPLGTVRGWEQGRRKPPPCAMLLMRIAMDHPEVFVGVSENDSDHGATKAQTPAAKKPERKAPSTDRITAELHEPGDDADFWLL